MAQVRVTVDGVNYADDVEPRMLLVHYLRERLGKTGTLVGCDTSNCGACTVHLNGQSVKSCSVLAVQADGGEVTTIEGLARDGKLHPVQEAFREYHALQCGYCTPGMIMPAVDLLGDNPDPDEQRGPRGHRGQPLPLHRLPEHRPGGAGRGAEDEAGRHRRHPGHRSGRRRRQLDDHDRRTHHARGRQGPRPQGGRAPDHRPHPLHRRHHPARHAAPRTSCARPLAHATITAIDNVRGRGRARRHRRLHRGRPGRRGASACPARGRSRRT